MIAIERNSDETVRSMVSSRPNQIRTKYKGLPIEAKRMKGF